MMEPFDIHQTMWERVHPLILKKRVPHALLFVGPRHLNLLAFVHRFIAIFLCEKGNPPCGKCRACHFLLQETHPDVHRVGQETEGGVIKIDPIRALHRIVYQTPQWGIRRFVVLESADKMNVSAANALLKMLEEPPEGTSFILIAEHINTLPATIISRCQTYVFPSTHCSSLKEKGNYFAIGEYYPSGSARSQLSKHRDAFVVDLCGVIEGAISPCSVAAKWSSYALEDLLWVLYLITALAIQQLLVGATPTGPCLEKLTHLSRLVTPVNLFYQLDQIHEMTQKMNHNININPTLALEKLLLGYSGIRG